MHISRLALPAIFLAGLAACTPEIDPPEVAACKSAVSAQSGGASATHVSTEPVIDGKAVKVRDDSSGTIWQCITDNAGRLEEIDIAS